MTDYVYPKQPSGLKEDRGMERESYEAYMYRTNKEERAIKKQIGVDHYKTFPIMPIEYIYKNKLNFLEGNIVKYISRHRSKNGAEDIKKIIHYAELILQLEYGEG